MSTVYDVAKYILDEYGSMSSMKLQKLIFYSQAMSLVWDEAPLFEDDFEAWNKGPVCKKLYNTHKGIYMLQDSSFLNSYNPSVSNIANEHKKTIDVVVESLIDVPSYKLSEMTHNEEPWKIARGSIPSNARSSSVITKDSMKKFYSVNW